MNPIELEVPLPAMPSRANERSGATHWNRHKLVKNQHHIFHEALLQVRHLQDSVKLPVDVLLTRISPLKLDDDNVRHSCKAFRDSLASYLRLPNDRDPRVRWEYAQEIDGRPKYTAVRFRIEPRADCMICGRSLIDPACSAPAAPFSLKGILTTLADAADHLLHEHDCDAHGHETIADARDAARELLRRGRSW